MTQPTKPNNTLGQQISAFIIIGIVYSFMAGLLIVLFRHFQDPNWRMGFLDALAVIVLFNFATRKRS